jgi:hypothetical protein
MSRRLITWNANHLAILCVLVGLVALAFAGTASAGTQISAAAGYGPSWIVEEGADCYVKNWQFDRTMYVHAPVIYAPNYTAGSGNDWRWVRFRTRLVNVYGQTVNNSMSWSPWAVAWDNSNAKFSGTQNFSFSTTSRAQIDIQWWNSTTLLGTATWQVSLYKMLLNVPLPGVANGSASNAC